MSVNKVILLGRAGKDPELKHTQGGSAVCNLSLATSESWTDKSGNKQEKTEWHKVQVWGKLAEIVAQYVKKGRQCYVEGKLATRSWEKDGQKFYATEIIANTVQFLGDNRSGNSSGAPENQSWGDSDVSAPANYAADDIPF